MRHKVLQLSFALAALTMTAFSSAKADEPDFAVCDGLSGAAWGLCRGGVAAGCDTATGNLVACQNIEDTFFGVTGVDAPWLVPPITCPCEADFNSIPKTSPPLERFTHRGRGRVTF